MSRVSVPLRLLLVLVACAPDPSPPPRDIAPVAAPAPVEVDELPPVDPRMAEHYRDAVAIKEAVISGELHDARAPARRLQASVDAYPATWRPFVAANSANAAVMLTAKDRRVAGAAAAGLARTCGDCHAAMGVGPSFPAPHDMPASAAHDPRQHMQRHQWAADRMWEALIDRSEYAWMAGAAAMAVPPMAQADITRDVELTDDVAALGERVHELGAQAATTVGWDARAGLYGEFLATCAGCHKGGC